MSALVWVNSPRQFFRMGTLRTRGRSGDEVVAGRSTKLANKGNKDVDTLTYISLNQQKYNYIYQGALGLLISRSYKYYLRGCHHLRVVHIGLPGLQCRVTDVGLLMSGN